MSFITNLPKIMGILNVTPDSFHDGGRYFSTAKAISHALEMVEQGADIIDIGGESTRPGAIPVSIEEEMQRVIPVICELKQEIKVPISIDTRHYEVMSAALDAGASIVNDISALESVYARKRVAQANVPVCLMHMKGLPSTMQVAPSYDDVVSEIIQFFENRIDECIEAGIAQDKIWIDPGFGFGKSLAHNLNLLGNLSDFRRLNCPILIGLSRKSMFGNILNKPTEQRLSASLAGVVIGALNGADIIRTHDVCETKDVLQVVHAIKPYFNTGRMSSDVTTA